MNKLVLIQKVVIYVDVALDIRSFLDSMEHALVCCEYVFHEFKNECPHIPLIEFHHYIFHRFFITSEDRIV